MREHGEAPTRSWRMVILSLVVAVVIAGALAVHAATAPSSAPAKSAALVAAANLPQCPASTKASRVTDGLPKLTLPCLGDGPAVRLDGLRGSPLVVNVWAGPCPPCKREAPLLQRFFAESSGTARLLGVVDGAYPDTMNDALSAAHGLGMRYPSVFDASGRLAAALRVRGIPVTVFADADGHIRYLKIGELHAGELEQLAQTYLGVHTR